MKKQPEEDKEIMTMLEKMNKKMIEIGENTEYKELAEYVHLMKHPKKIIAKNLLAGIARGVGIAIGFSVFLVTMLYFLKALGALNIPIIGDYIADIVEIVQAQLEGRSGY
jgi:hypothetical protein